MLAPHHVIFTAVEGTLVQSGTARLPEAEEALSEIQRQHMVHILVTSGTRAQLEPLRSKIEHGHPFISEHGGGLFCPDGYFAIHLEGVTRAGRYLCVPFGQSSAEAADMVREIAEEAGVEAVGYSEMTAREIARNTGTSVKLAEMDREREFSERFFLAGDVEQGGPRFVEIAERRKCQVVTGEPFWELSCNNDTGKAVRYLMKLCHQTYPRTRLKAVGVGSCAADLALLTAVDQAILLPRKGSEYDPTLTARLPHAVRGDIAGASGWNQAVMQLIERPGFAERREIPG